jgi:hypothetical protein
LENAWGVEKRRIELTKIKFMIFPLILFRLNM